jgi:diguanylate cyclase (GGDEF)-like protein
MTPEAAVYPWFETLCRSRLFRNVPRHVAGAVAAGSTTRDLVPGEILIEAGQRNESIYVLLEGQLEVNLTADGPPHVQLAPGEIVGEVSVLDQQSATASVRATAPSLVLEVDAEALWALIDRTPEVARNLLHLLSGRIRHDDEVLAESVRLQRYFERAATVDGLTGLRNRRWLDDAFARQLARTVRGDQPASLLMIDIDRFKELNDRHGHLAGDAVLCRVAHVLARNLRPRDLLARYGGEEFCVLLPETDTDEALIVAERLRAAVEAPGAADEEPLPAATVSVGVATAHLSDSLEALLSLADEALYRAKEGRNRVSR